jgi:hypothetical protein
MPLWSVASEGLVVDISSVEVVPFMLVSIYWSMYKCCNFYW